MKKISDEELRKVLNLHEKWLRGEKNGVRADLSCTDLSNKDLSYTNLTAANLDYALLENSDLRCSFLNSTNFLGANLRNANLSDAILERANFLNACLTDVNLEGAYLSNNILINTDLSGVKYEEKTKLFDLQCPEKGSFIGYKLAIAEREHPCIIELLIPKDAKRSSATSRSCRCSKAKVLSITSFDEMINYTFAYSYFDETFIYQVGKIVEVKDFDENRWNECSTGIHFFITRGEAVSYYYSYSFLLLYQ